MNVQVPATPTESVGRATVEVGRVFGNGGTDGLILYALILATFLMFLAIVIVATLCFRAIARKDANSAEVAKAFAEASNDSAGALRELATTIAAQGATDAAHRLSATVTLSRIESVLSRVDPPHA